MTDTVLFLCPHGAAKSVLAAALFERLAAEQGLPLRTMCAGTEPDPEVAPHIRALLEREGLPLPVDQPQLVTRVMLDGAACVISLGCSLDELPGTPRRWELWDDVPPPSQDLQGAYARIKEHLAGWVPALGDEMRREHLGRVAIVYHGDEAARRSATADNNRFAPLFSAFAERGIQAEPAVYHDDVHLAVRDQLLQVDAALVWVNPIEGGRDRSLLDGMLREVADAGVFVSAHPDTILKLGTKEVLYTTRGLGWGSDTHVYRTLDQLARELPGRLAAGKARVLKQHRGHSGIGVWKVSLAAPAEQLTAGSGRVMPQETTLLRVRHAQRGSAEEELVLEAFLRRCEPYFAGEGRMIDQAYQERLPEGMIRCYLVQNKVAGFGHQAINALYPAPEGAASGEAPQPGPRLYYPPTQPAFQAVKDQLEQEWLPAAQQLLAIPTERLPVLWDCDFLLGPRAADGTDTYVLCEINVSSVAPYPDSATPAIVEATQAQIRRARQRRGLIT